MKLTKDECLILAEALSDSKHQLNNHYANESFNANGEVYTKLNELEAKLREAGYDQRRTGRTSQNSFTDLVKRFIKK